MHRGTCTSRVTECEAGYGQGIWGITAVGTWTNNTAEGSEAHQAITGISHTTSLHLPLPPVAPASLPLLPSQKHFWSDIFPTHDIPKGCQRKLNHIDVCPWKIPFEIVLCFATEQPQKITLSYKNMALQSSFSYGFPNTTKYFSVSSCHGYNRFLWLKPSQ